MQTTAAILQGPEAIGLAQLGLTRPAAGDVVVAVRYSGISTGTEKLFWSGTMPPFPGMGYPLVPGYEATGEVVEAGPESALRVGETVFVPGANCYDGAKGLFGAAAATLVSDAARCVRVDSASGAEGALLALAATARHALAGQHAAPELIVGHGVLGRLLARLTLAAGHPAPTVWEIDPARAEGAEGYPVMCPEDDPRRDYQTIYDASGRADILNDLVLRLAKGGEIVLAGFYADDLRLAFPPAFMKEARLRIAAEWTRDDLIATRGLIDAGALSLSGLITHYAAPNGLEAAYRTAFTDRACLKMVLDWKGHA